MWSIYYNLTVTVNEIEALYDLFKKLSSSIINDGLIHKEEFQLALLITAINRISLLIDAPEADKIEFLFRLYDLRQTGYIVREELKEMVLALLTESDLSLSNDMVESIVEKTMMEADIKGDGKIDEEEWREFVKKNPSILKNMTLPYLKELTLAFPSFVLNTEVQD
ncbi:hypothetical protein REPUB_Repub07fG0178900 [Reevesia pubescens]